MKPRNRRQPGRPRLPWTAATENNRMLRPPVSVRHCTATTAPPRNCCPNCYAEQNRVTKTMSVAPPLGTQLLLFVLPVLLFLLLLFLLLLVLRLLLLVSVDVKPHHVYLLAVTLSVGMVTLGIIVSVSCLPPPSRISVPRRGKYLDPQSGNNSAALKQLTNQLMSCSLAGRY